MDRRQFTAGFAVLATVPAVFAAQDAHVDYTPEAYASAMAAGTPVLLDFYAPW